MAEALIFLVLICLIASDYKKLNSNSARGAAFRIGYCLISMLMPLPRRQIALEKKPAPLAGKVRRLKTQPGSGKFLTACLEKNEAFP